MPQSARLPSASTVPLSRGYLRYALAILFLVNVVNYMDRMILSIVVEPVKQELSLSDTQIGLMTGLAFAIFYGLAGLYVARLADSIDRRIVLSVAIAIWSGMTALSGVARNFWHLFAARIGVGIGEAGAIPTANALISDYFPPQRRAAALAIFTSGATIGLTGGLWFGGYIAETYGWRWAFLAAAVPGLPLALIVWLTIREVPRGSSDGVAPSLGVAAPVSESGLSTLRDLLRDRTYRHLLVAASVVCFMLFGVSQWMPALVMRRFGMGVADVGMQFGSALGFGFAAGAILGGFLANTLAKADIRWLIRLPFMASFFYLPLCELAIYAPTPLSTFIAIFLLNVIGGASFGPMLAAIQTIVPPTRRATAAAVFGFVTQVVGIGGMAFAIGVASDALAPSMGTATALQTALGVAALFSVLGVVYFYRAGQEFSASVANRRRDRL